MSSNYGSNGSLPSESSSVFSYNSSDEEGHFSYSDLSPQYDEDSFDLEFGIVSIISLTQDTTSGSRSSEPKMIRTLCLFNIRKVALLALLSHLTSFQVNLEKKPQITLLTRFEKGRSRILWAHSACSMQQDSLSYLHVRGLRYLIRDFLVLLVQTSQRSLPILTQEFQFIIKNTSNTWLLISQGSQLSLLSLLILVVMAFPARNSAIWFDSLPSLFHQQNISIWTSESNIFTPWSHIP